MLRKIGENRETIFTCIDLIGDIDDLPSGMGR